MCESQPVLSRKHSLGKNSDISGPNSVGCVVHDTHKTLLVRLFSDEHTDAHSRAPYQDTSRFIRLLHIACRHDNSDAGSVIDLRVRDTLEIHDGDRTLVIIAL